MRFNVSKLSRLCDHAAFRRLCVCVCSIPHDRSLRNWLFGLFLASTQASVSTGQLFRRSIMVCEAGLASLVQVLDPLKVIVLGDVTGRSCLRLTKMRDRVHLIALYSDGITALVGSHSCSVILFFVLWFPLF